MPFNLSSEMFEALVDFDQRLFLLLNQAGTPFWDPIMRFLSSAWVWVPVFAFVLYRQIRTQRKGAWIGLAVLIIVYAACDQISNNLFKETIQRMRPCHDESLADQVRLVAHRCGGLYGFVSSHATNSMGIALYTLLLIRNRHFTWIILFWALLVSYSRIYLGVHFPADILGGLILGALLALAGWWLLKKLPCNQPVTRNMSCRS